MSGLKPSKQPKTIKAGYCQFCRKDMRAMKRGLSRKYCSEDCSTRARSAPTKTVSTLKRKPDAYSGAFFSWLILELIRAGTDQILNGVGEKELSELYDIFRFCNAANGYNPDSRQFEKCHIASVNGGDVLGLLHPKNIVVASADLNRKHGVNHFNSAGVFIPRSDVVKNIPPNITRAQAIKRILNKIGEEVVLRVIKQKKIQPSQREKYIAFILNRSDDHTETQLIEMGNKELAEIDADVRERQVSNYRYRTSGYSEEYVAVHEAIRFGFVGFLEFSNKLDWLDGHVMQTMWSYNNHDLSEELEYFRDSFSKLAFDAFHGSDNWQTPLAALSVELDALQRKVMEEEAQSRVVESFIPLPVVGANTIPLPVKTFAFDPEECPF
ncbi:hypothetical protein [Pseudomonas sp. PSE14]|uniref:hypothetical protein n=1 Tax=Pseudomonas sp. PSE14 TaxID=3016341 RepID=UPI0023D87D20|nr:hypothetical protein [Pseudomonas sp. PSE14]WEJ70446.1 hypothetical protein O6P39_17415 [Pseudomonas sp. PSE14]